MRVIPTEGGVPVSRNRLPARFAAFFLLVTVLLAWGFAAAAGAEEIPKLRALTAFVRLDRAHYQEQVREALGVLRAAKARYERAGYEVQTLRISTQPFPDYVQGLSEDEALAFFREYEKLVKEEGFLAAIGPAMLSDSDDPRMAQLLGEIQLATSAFDASLVVAGEDGVYWNAVPEAARLMKHWAEHSAGGTANFRFAATALLPLNTPFYPGSYHLGAGRQFAVALESPNVVEEAFLTAGSYREAREMLAAALGRHASAVEEIARRVEREAGWEYMGIDLSPAPLAEVSIGGAIERLSGAKFGSSGTMTAAALITDVLRKVPVKRAGYSGLMVPVLEDAVLAQRWSEGVLTMDALLAYSAVCGTGLDTVPLPGEVTVEQLERIIGDVASLAVKLHKPLSARLMPVPGKKAGDRTEFDDPFLVNTILQPLP